MKSKEKLTASRMTCWLFCQRKHLYAYDYGIRSTADRDALVFGTAWHAAQEWYYNHRDESADKALGMLHAAFATAEEWDEFVCAKLTACIKAWYQVYGNQDVIKTMQAEVEFSYPIEGSRTFEAAGKIDGLALLTDGRTALVEHKTTSEDLSPESSYWTRLRFNPQLCRYVLGARAMGFDCDTVIYDVMRKPAIKPKESVKVVDENGIPYVMDEHGFRAYKKDGTPKKTADAAKGEYYETKAEIPDEYCTRLYEDIMSRPDFYFARREVRVSEEQLAAFRDMESAMARQILDARERGRNACARSGNEAAYESAFMMNVGRMTCVGCDYENFCMSGTAIDANNPPEGFALVGSTPELGAK